MGLGRGEDVLHRESEAWESSWPDMSAAVHGWSTCPGARSPARFPALQTYARGRVALTGDAAHLGTPFLGQVS